MNTHTQVRQLFDEYLRGELTEEDRAPVEEHLRACPRCARQAEEYRALLKLPLDHLRDAASERSPGYWQDFPLQVERRLRREEERATRPTFGGEWEALISWLTLRHRSVFAVAGAAAAILLAAVLFWRPFSPAGTGRIAGGGGAGAEAAGGRTVIRDIAASHSAARSGTPSPTITQANERTEQYFRKSQTLLVGLVNRKFDDGQPPDLSSEQAASRELLHEARYLKSQPIDMRSAQLIGDLERILIELANLKQQYDIPNVEIIRAGIHQENLLFKVRMAGTRADSSRLQTAKNSY